MKRSVRLAAVLCLVAAVVTLSTAVLGQTDGASKPSAGDGKASVQGYTRTNRTTGQPEQVRPHKRRPPTPKPVPVRPYLRQGQPVSGHQRRLPAKPLGG